MCKTRRHVRGSTSFVHRGLFQTLGLSIRPSLSHFGQRRHPIVCLGDHRHHCPAVASPHLVCPRTSLFSSLSPVGSCVLAFVGGRALHGGISDIERLARRFSYP